MECPESFVSTICDPGCNPICNNYEGDFAKVSCPYPAPSDCKPSCVCPNGHALLTETKCVPAASDECGGDTYIAN